MLPTRFPRPAEFAVASAVLLLAACSGDTALAPSAPVTRTITVDASAAYAYLKLDTIAQPVSVASPTTSSAWDIGFFATGVTLNGGAAGPGGVTGYCLCRNEAATTAQVQAFTAMNQLPVSDSVTAAAVPPASAFQADLLDPAINGWYSGTAGAGATVTAGRTFILRKSVGGATILAKFQVTGVTAPTAATPGQVSFQFAIQPSAGAAFGATLAQTVTVAAGTVAYFDLAANALGTVASWDIAFDGWAIRTNGGVSGSGGVKAVPDAVTAFASIDATYAASAPAVAYRGDTFSGVFAAHPWYRYNITGSDNQIWPMFNVYLVKTPAGVFKIQLTSYYSAAGAPRNITVRYAKIAG
ncbi:MAG: HmuY family protein [Gemmatimonadetes bacterium]|nr:HmuY family protein [Gemmatimonadota bacterium]